jgi:hypothetical protein
MARHTTMLIENKYGTIGMILSRTARGVALPEAAVLGVLAIDWTEKLIAGQSPLEVWWAWFTTVGRLLRYMANLQLLSTSTGKGAISFVIPV